MAGFAKSTKLKVWNKTGGLCWYCGNELVWDKEATETLPGGDIFTIDHFVAKELGGNGKIDNLVPACRRCNCRKAHRPLEAMRRNIAECAGMILFTDKQLEYLTSLGITLPEQEMPVFYFEVFHCGE